MDLDTTPPSPSPGSYFLNLLDAQSNMLQQISFAPEQGVDEDESGQPVAAQFVIAVPTNASIHEVQISDGANILADIVGNTNMPSVSSPILSPGLADALKKLPSPVNTPYRTEVNLGGVRWIGEIGSRLQNGFVLMVDYGYSRDEYYKPERTGGTLACYSRHRRSFNPLENPGGVDMTAHADFTSLAESAERAGLHVAGYTDQHHFMVGATESYLLQIERENGRSGLQPYHHRFLGKLKTLMHPANMGMAFKYLLLATSTELRAPSGFKYAREPRQALGL